MRTQTLLLAALAALSLSFGAPFSFAQAHPRIDSILLGSGHTNAELKDLHDKVAFFERHCEKVHPNTDIELCVSLDLKEARQQNGGPMGVVIPQIE